MIKEKHKWKKQKEYINVFGDSKNHYIIEYLQCTICGKTKGVLE
jgi:hypothetical protein